MFRVGQKVVCINSENRPGKVWIWDDAPTEGKVYTISALSFERGERVVELIELPRHPESKLRGYAAFRFRPIVERKTDIAIFTKLLAPTKQRAMEDAS